MASRQRQEEGRVDVWERVCIERRVAITCHMEFPVHHCYGGIWPAIDSRSVTGLPSTLMQDSRPGRGAAGVGFLWPLTLAVAHTAQALPHLPCWLLEPLAEGNADRGSSLRRFITSAFITWVWAYGAGLSYGNVGSCSESLCVR